MLKVKEGIDLKELKKKFGFIGEDFILEKSYTEKGYGESITLMGETKKIVSVSHGMYLLDTLYDLITAGIVVKE